MLMPSQHAVPVLRSKRPRLRRPWQSLRWKLTVVYIGCFSLLLAVLGGLLLITVNNLLFTNAAHTFTDEARAIALSRHTAYFTATMRRDINGNCTTNYNAAFASVISDPLSQAPSTLQIVALIDLTNGAEMAPDSSISPPLNFDADKLQQLRQSAGNGASMPAWEAAVARATAVTYAEQINGKPGEVLLQAYDYRVPISCVKNTWRTMPAVLMLAQDFGPTQSIINSFKWLLLGCEGLLFVLGLAIGLPLTNASLRPLTQVAETARSIAAGEQYQRLHMQHRHDEVGELGQAFDEMMQALEDAFAMQLRSEERMRQFIGDASHELRNPIAAVRGALEVLARNGYDDTAEVDRLIRSARNESERMARLVNDLLLLARFDMGRPLELFWTDLARLVGDAVEQTRLLAGGRQVEFSASGSVVAMIDADRIKQVMLVLLDNALKYGRQDETGQVQVQLTVQENQAMLTISDNGPGIAPDDLANIFDRFYRGKQGSGRTVGGSGLGLPIAQAIVQAHRGTIRVASTLDVGTSFTITLPLDGSPPPVALPAD